MKAKLVPLTGPSSILLALMASGMNGQLFCFNGYLPIDTTHRMKALRELEADINKKNSTHIFIETPYRNNQMLQSILNTLQPGLRLCVAVDLTGQGEWIKTMTLAEWKQDLPDLHKKTCIFLLGR
jgi:16S rRNA (cytidine1402-2'-O)-methyltransferase